MKIDEIIRNPYYIVAGILLALISLILMGYALAIGGCIDYPNEYYEGFVGYPLQTESPNSVLESIEDDLVEFVAQDGCGRFDTEQGTIEVYDYYLPDLLPLCITQDVLDNYWVTLKVKGGYEPIGGSVILCQKGDYKGTVEIVWEYVGHEPCYYDYWTAHLVLPDGVDSIELDSNQWPDGAIPFSDCDTIPGKEVVVSYSTLWQGCHEERQRFRLIQTQIKSSSGRPQLPMKY